MKNSQRISVCIFITADWLLSHSVMLLLRKNVCWRSRDRISLGETFHTHPDRSWDTQSSVQWVLGLFPGVKVAGALITPSSAEIKERVELYLYSLSGPSLPLLCWALPFTFTNLCFLLHLISFRNRRNTINCVNFLVTTSTKWGPGVV